jgi:hypothetical protein
VAVLPARHLQDSMDPDAAGRAVLLVAPLLLLGVGLGAAVAVGAPTTLLLPGAVGLVVVAAAMYYFAGLTIDLRGPADDPPGDD